MTPLEALDPIVRLIFVAIALGMLSIGLALVISALSDPELRDDTHLFTRPCCNSIADNPHRWSCATWGDLDNIDEDLAA